MISDLWKYSLAFASFGNAVSVITSCKFLYRLQLDPFRRALGCLTTSATQLKALYYAFVDKLNYDDYSHLLEWLRVSLLFSLDNTLAMRAFWLDAVTDNEHLHHLLFGDKINCCRPNSVLIYLSSFSEPCVEIIGDWLYDGRPISSLGVGSFLEVVDAVDRSYIARIVFKFRGRFFIHYLGWTSKYDEWIPIDSPRLSMKGTRQLVSEHGVVSGNTKFLLNDYTYRLRKRKVV
jgi:hypothetical protein